MTVPLRVLGNRVLVRPGVNANAPETLPSGLLIAKSLAAAVVGEDATVSVHRGTVVAVGHPKHPLQHEADALAAKVDARLSPTRSDAELMADVVHLLHDLVRRQPAVMVDDDVLFSHDAGQQITLIDETYVLLQEDELLAVVEPEREDTDGRHTQA